MCPIVAGCCGECWQELPHGGLLIRRGNIRKNSLAKRYGGRAGLMLIGTLALYGGIASALLLGFFLRNCVISSRYLLDLMPSFAALMVAGWMAWTACWASSRYGLWIGLVSLAVLLGWLGWELSHGGSAYGPPRVLTWKEVAARKTASSGSVRMPTSGYYASPAAPAETGIPYNGAGWEAPSGMVMPCVILFVDSPEILELELTSEQPTVGMMAPDAFRAKVGLEFLRRRSIKRTDRGWMVRFDGPTQRQYQHGLQPVFLATVTNTHLADSSTRWRLLRVSWKSEGGRK